MAQLTGIVLRDGTILECDALKDVQFAMNAAAQGAIAGETINREFEFEEGRML